MEATENGVAVIIAAYRAANTIGPAIHSALRQPETAEIVVVDDCSNDGTPEAATLAGGGDPRVKVLRQTVNGGPSRARNRGIAESSAPWIAVLDADDALLPGRFAALLRGFEWDFRADNIVFIQDMADPAATEHMEGDGLSCQLNLVQFIEGNLPQRDRVRGELGFLKPIFSRGFIEHNRLSYRDDCRLGEDFLFYVEALAKGARFRLDRQCGYAALRREDSLSWTHRTQDLGNLAAGTRELMDSCDLTVAARKALTRHWRSTRARLAHREVLDARRARGLTAALLKLAFNPSVFGAILHDKLMPKRATTSRAGRLVSDEEFNALC